MGVVNEFALANKSPRVSFSRDTENSCSIRNLNKDFNTNKSNTTGKSVNYVLVWIGITIEDINLY